MAALLVMLAVMAVLMSVAMPVYRQQARREKEAELVFRGEQYARAIALYRHRNAQIPNALPPSIDVLVEGRYLRKKYKDPMTKDGEFMVISAAQQGTPGPQTNPPVTNPGRATMPPLGGRAGGTVGIGGIMGVRSKSEETSLRSYRGQTRYDQWQFTFNLANRPGGAMPMANTNDPRGQNPGVTLPDGRNPFGGPGSRGGTNPPRIGPGAGRTGPGGSGARGPRTGGPGSAPQTPPGGRSGTVPGGGRGPGR
jgi:type II secretory pathway pseudopilin PulG